MAAARPAGLLPDVVLALAITVFAQFDVAFDLGNSARYGPMPPLVVSTAAATLALAWRRVAPLTTAVIVAAALAGPMLVTPLTFSLWGGFLPLLVATYSVARHSERTPAWPASRSPPPLSSS